MPVSIIRRLLGRSVSTTERHPAAPTAATVDRLRRRLGRHNRVQAARFQADLDEIDRALEAGDEPRAAAVLAEYEQVLRAYAETIEHLVAESVVVRDAEDLAVSAADDTEAEARPHASWSRRALGGGVAVVLVALLALDIPPTGQPDGALGEEVMLAERQLAAAETRLLALAEGPAGPTEVLVTTQQLHDHILGLRSEALADERVRARIDELLELEVTILERLAERAPEVRQALAESEALRASLELDRDPEEPADERRSATTPPDPADRGDPSLDDPSVPRVGAPLPEALDAVEEVVEELVEQADTLLEDLDLGGRLGDRR